MVLAGFVDGFGWFWLVPCFSNYAENSLITTTASENLATK